MKDIDNSIIEEQPQQTSLIHSYPYNKHHVINYQYNHQLLLKKVITITIIIMVFLCMYVSINHSHPYSNTPQKHTNGLLIYSRLANNTNNTTHQGVKNKQQQSLPDFDQLQAINLQKINKIEGMLHKFLIQKQRSTRLAKPVNKRQYHTPLWLYKIQQQTDKDSDMANQDEQIQQERRKQQAAAQHKVNMKDFQAQPAYINADDNIKQIFDEMIARDPSKMNPPNPFFSPTQKAYFALRLYQNPDNQNYQKAEYYYYDYKYHIGSYLDQLPLCIIAPGRNLGGNFKQFIDSILRQNYTNYKLIYIDDFSDDGTVEDMSQYVRKHNQKGLTLNRNFIIVKNGFRIYALGNRNNGIRKYCSQNDIVLDVDADDSLIGRQVFKFVNAIYHDQDLWQSNSVFIYVDKDQKQVTTGPQDGVPKDILEKNMYRGSMIWKTSELRTFRAKLFNKINEEDFKDKDGVFYKWASDAFMMEPLIELAGPKHYKHFYQVMYYYNWSLNWNTIYERRHFRDIAWTQTPYNPLQTLDSEATKVKNYQIPQKMKKQFMKNDRKARQQAIKNHRKIDF